MKIKVLPDTVINQIAAGEVVERPASVIRELVDNAIDAGATDIFIAVEGGGHSRLKVRDNGCGMTRDEAILAFERHATSKVSAIEDLNMLATLGFRGEALASIAAVSKVRLTTRSREADVGTAITFRGGKLVDVQSCAWNEGTEIEVEHLFFNTPARRKFLKSPRAELSRIRTWVTHSSLARPGVRYRLVADGTEVLNLPAVSTIEARGASVFPGDLMQVSFKEGSLAVQGRVGHPGLALADATGFVLLVNGRLVTDKIMLRAAREGYDSMLKDREYPIGYLALTLPPDEVDVNVHPQKSEVRFRHPDQIFAIVRAAVLTAVRGIKRPMIAPPVQTAPAELPTRASSPPPQVSAPSLASGSFAAAMRSESPLPPQQEGRTAAAASFPSSAPRPDVRDIWPVLLAKTSKVEPATSLFDAEPQPAVLREQRPLYEHQGHASSADAAPRTEFRFSALRYVGQILGCYLVCELGEQLVVVDMHAAHERVTYNKIRQQRAARTLLVQKLLIPERVVLTEEQVVALIEQQDLLKEIAFEITQEDSNAILIHGVPNVVSHLQCAALLKEFAAEPVVAGWRERLDERIDHIAARLACHASVRSGHVISKDEAYALFAQLDEANSAAACPHGRPVVAEFSRAAVERWFGRDR
jgi:DNA mismatch repair protein MutL